MSGLGRDARGIVAQARAGDGPSAEDRARIRAKLEPSWAAFRARQTGGHASDAAAALTRRRTPWGAFALWMSLTLWPPQLEAPRAEALADVAAGQLPAGVDRQAARTPQLMASGDAAPNPNRSAAASGLADALARRAQDALASRDGLSRQASLGGPRAGDITARAESHRRERSARAPSMHAASRGATGTDAQEASAARSAAVPNATAANIARSASAAVPNATAANIARGGSVARSAAVPTATAANLSQGATPDAPASNEASLALSPRARGGDAVEAGDATPSQRNPGFVAQPLDDELEWIGAAQDALRKHQPTTVLRLVQEHAFRYPQGALAPERLALHALALCALQRRAAARTVVAELARRTPASPLLDRVQRNCGL